MQEATPTVPTVKRWLLSLTIQHAHEPILPWPHDFATLAFDSKSKWGWETPAPSTEGRCTSQTFVLLFGSPKLSVAHIPIFNFPVTTRICTPKAAAAQTYVWMKAFLIRRFIHTHTHIPTFGENLENKIHLRNTLVVFHVKVYEYRYFHPKTEKIQTFPVVRYVWGIFSSNSKSSYQIILIKMN